MTWPRENFNKIQSSMLSIFIVIVGEDWNQVMYQYVRAAGEGSSLGWTIATIYFTLTIVFGNFTLLALFTALLLKNFDRVEDEDEEEKKKLETS